MPLTNEEQEALSAYYIAVRALDDSVIANGEDIGNADVAKHNAAAEAAYARCRKLGWFFVRNCEITDF